jgi:hypothetical protein
MIDTWLNRVQREKRMKKSVFYSMMCLIMAATMTTASWVAAQEEKPKTPEQKAWEEVDSFSKQSLQDFLKSFPEGTLAQQAKTAIELQDKLAVLNEKKSEPGFTIPLDMLGERWKAWQKMAPGKGVIGYFIKKGEGKSKLGWFPPKPFSGGKTLRRDTFSFDERGLLISPTGDGSIVAFRTYGLKFELFNGLVFETPGEEPMYFGVIPGKGLVHLKGPGKVTLPNGKTMNLR